MDITERVAAMSDQDVLAYKTKTKTENYTKYTLEERKEWAKNLNNKEEFLRNRLLNNAILKRQKELLGTGKAPDGEGRPRRSDTRSSKPQ